MKCSVRTISIYCPGLYAVYTIPVPLITCSTVKMRNTAKAFLISHFHTVLNVAYFFLGNSPASEFLYADVSEHSVPSS